MVSAEDISTQNDFARLIPVLQWGRAWLARKTARMIGNHVSLKGCFNGAALG